MAFSNWITTAKDHASIGNQQDLILSFYEMKTNWSDARESFLNSTGRCLDTEFGAWWAGASDALNSCDSNTITWLDNAQNLVNSYGDVSSVYVI